MRRLHLGPQSLAFKSQLAFRFDHFRMGLGKPGSSTGIRAEGDAQAQGQGLRPSGAELVTLAPGVEDYSVLPSALLEAGFRLTLFREEEVNLETAFMELTKGVQQ